MQIFDNKKKSNEKPRKMKNKLRPNFCYPYKEKNRNDMTAIDEQMTAIDEQFYQQNWR